MSLRLVSAGMELFAKAAGGVLEVIPYDAVARYKKQVCRAPPAAADACAHGRGR